MGTNDLESFSLCVYTLTTEEHSDKEFAYCSFTVHFNMSKKLLINLMHCFDIVQFAIM